MVNHYDDSMLRFDWIGLDWNALFHVDKIVEKKSNYLMHNTSSSSYQSICLIKVNVKNNNNNNDNNNNNNNDNNKKDQLHK